MFYPVSLVCGLLSVSAYGLGPISVVDGSGWSRGGRGGGDGGVGGLSSGLIES